MLCEKRSCSAISVLHQQVSGQVRMGNSTGHCWLSSDFQPSCKTLGTSNTTIARFPCPQREGKPLLFGAWGSRGVWGGSARCRSSPAAFWHLLPCPCSYKLRVKIEPDRPEAILNKPVKATSLLGFKRQKLQVRGSTACLPREDPINSSSATCKDQSW